MCAKSLQSYSTLGSPMNCCPPASSVQGDSPGENTGVGCHALFQGIFPAQTWNPRVSYISCIRQAGSLPLAPPGRPRFNPWVRKIPWRRKWLPTPVFLPGKSYGQGSLAGHSPWGCTSRIRLTD